MNIASNYFSSYTVSFFKQSFLLSLTAQQKKVALVASVVFGCLLTCYLVTRCWKSSATPLNQEKAQEKKKSLSAENESKFKEKSVFNDVIWEGEEKCADKQFNGPGKLTFSYGDIFEGQFKKGLLNGQGKKITNQGHVISEGPFSDGVLHGDNGKQTFKDYKILEGKFVAGELYGPGKITYSEGPIKEGEFKVGDLIKGKITYPTGEVKEGCFNGVDELKGKGKRIYADGRIEEGTFQGDVFIHP